jgi:hypothetical protein
MEPLYNQKGATYAWLHANGNVYSLQGAAVAFVEGEGVYNWEGCHIGWWANGHMRDAVGEVCLFTKDAKNTGVVKPVRDLHQQRPLRLETPVRPLKWPRPAKPPNLWSWSKNMPF